MTPFSYCPQHFLYFLPLPQGQGSFRPIFIVIPFDVVVAAVSSPRLMIIILPLLFLHLRDFFFTLNLNQAEFFDGVRP